MVVKCSQHNVKDIDILWEFLFDSVVEVIACTASYRHLLQCCLEVMLHYGCRELGKKRPHVRHHRKSGSFKG